MLLPFSLSVPQNKSTASKTKRQKTEVKANLKGREGYSSPRTQIQLISIAVFQCIHERIGTPLANMLGDGDERSNTTEQTSELVQYQKWWCVCVTVKEKDKKYSDDLLGRDESFHTTIGH